MFAGNRCPVENVAKYSYTPTTGRIIVVAVALFTYVTIIIITTAKTTKTPSGRRDINVSFPANRAPSSTAERRDLARHRRRRRPAQTDARTRNIPVGMFVYVFARDRR